jgi:hypothetical protein
LKIDVEGFESDVFDGAQRIFSELKPKYIQIEFKWHQIFCNKLEFDSYTYDIDPVVLTPKNLILLDRYLTCPYYLTCSRNDSRLVLFGSKEAMMAALHGDMQRFINSLSY